MFAFSWIRNSLNTIRAAVLVLIEFVAAKALLCSNVKEILAQTTVCSKQYMIADEVNFHEYSMQKKK